MESGRKCFYWPPRRRASELVVAIPGSVLATEETLELKTIKSGLIARFLAVFRVDTVALYSDPDTNRRDLELLGLLLEYSITPPHLKRKIFPLMPELRYAGLLYPVKLYSHVAPKRPGVGDKMEGVIEECEGSLCSVYLGPRVRGFIPREEGYKRGQRIVVEVVGVGAGRTLKLSKSSWGEIYAGFRVESGPWGHLRGLLRSYKRKECLIIGTDKEGECIAEGSRGLSELSRAPCTLIVFGGPYRGITEYTDREDYDVILNTIPSQGVESVRTEEALISTLAIINYLDRL